MEDGAARAGRLKEDRTAVGQYNLSGNRQPQARAVRLGAFKQAEYLDILGDAGTAVGHGNSDPAPGTGASADTDAARPLADRLHRVLDQVVQHAMDFLLVGAHAQRQSGAVKGQIDTPREGDLLPQRGNFG